MATTRLPPDFKELLKLLNETDVRYMVIGGYAVSFYGYPRATGDIDIWIDSEAENIKKTLIALEAFGIDKSVLPVTLFSGEKPIIRIGMPPVRVELMTVISGVTFLECFAESTTNLLDGVSTRIISLPRLLQNKRSAGRHKDFDDIEQLTKSDPSA